MDMNFASKAVGTAGLTTGIIGSVGTALGLLNGGANLLGGATRTTSAGDVAQVASTVAEMAGITHRCSENMPVTRYDVQNLKELMAKDQEIAILKSEQNTEVKIADVYERIMTRVNQDQREQAAWNANQSVANAQMSAAIATNSNSIAALQNCCNQITKIVVPNTSICPGWGNVTITPATSGTTTA